MFVRLVASDPTACRPTFARRLSLALPGNISEHPPPDNRNGAIISANGNEFPLREGAYFPKRTAFSRTMPPKVSTHPSAAPRDVASDATSGPGLLHQMQQYYDN